MTGNKNSKGFSLLEVIISVAALSCMSLFILEMFLVSANLNGRAKDVDIALAEAISVVESFKALSEPGKISASDTGALTVTQYYDKNWERVDEDITYGTRYHLRMEANPIRDSREAAGELYDVIVEIVDFSNEANPRMLASLQTKKYFPILDLKSSE